MKIRISDAGKRFNREWIFRNANIEFSSSNAYAITGPNGSGKSTLLQVIGGMLQVSEGSIQYLTAGQGGAISDKSSFAEATADKQLANEEVYRHISFCAPYLDVIEEMTLIEFLQFHNRFKNFITGFDVRKIIASVRLENAANKQIRYYSSGMKQRVRLAQAIFSDTDIVLLDEPCSNLDADGIELYHYLVERFCKERIVIVCSNDEVEYNFCNEIISMTSFKKNSNSNDMSPVSV